MEPFFKIWSGKIYPMLEYNENIWDEMVRKFEINNKPVIWEIILTFAKAGQVLDGPVRTIFWDWIIALALHRLGRVT